VQALCKAMICEAVGEGEPHWFEMSNDSAGSSVLTINGGSSSIKFALFRIGEPFERWFDGNIDRIGQPGSALSFHDAARQRRGSTNIDTSAQQSVADNLVDWLETNLRFDSICAVGHRVVHGMYYSEPMRVTPELLDELNRICPYDPDHLPREISLIEAFRKRHPKLPQVACFDTAFHRSMPRVARLLPIPRRFDAQGIQRYGFHGLSYEFLLRELARVAGGQASRGRVILAHLGGGASMAAVRGGKSIDTSMGFTPAGGLPMGTRPGDLDPGAAWQMISTEALTPQQFNHLINHECGLLGISETSSDMRDLLARQAGDIRCAEAVELFCYQARKWLGAFAAALGGLDTVVFSGGIGENTGEVRARICEELQFLGIDLDAPANAANAPLISTAASRVQVRVIKTDEEQTIARHVRGVLLPVDEEAKGGSND
jgi:acetate kinase